MNAVTDILHESILRRFKDLNETNRLAHAYLLIGPALTGKSTTAFNIAKAINCLDKKSALFCDTCPSCIKINNRQHADVHLFVSQDGEAIKIEQVRQLIAESQLRPFEAQKKVFIIQNVEDVSLDASHALLKTLEEPSANSLILLTSSSAEKIIDTIKSRCQIIYLPSLAPHVLKSRLVKENHFDEQSSHFLAYFSQGSLGKALSLQKKNILSRKNEIIDNFFYVKDSDVYFKGILSDKEKTKEALSVLLSWLRDLLLLKSGAGCSGLINIDRMEDLQKSKDHYKFQQLEETLREVAAALNSLDENFNIKVALALIKESLCQRQSKLN